MNSITNIFCADLGWFLKPLSSSDYFELLPDYWMGLYPITYYFIGCYLKEYPLKLSCKTIALASFLLFLANGSFNYYRSYGFFFVEGIWQEYYSLPVVLQAVLFFSFFVGLDYSKFPGKASRLLAKLSDATLGAYLVSWIFDTTFYYFLNDAIVDMRKRIIFFPLVVPLTAACSLLVSMVMNAIYNFIAGIIRKRLNAAVPDKD